MEVETKTEARWRETRSYSDGGPYSPWFMDTVSSRIEEYRIEWGYASYSRNDQETYSEWHLLADGDPIYDDPSIEYKTVINSETGAEEIWSRDHYLEVFVTYYGYWSDWMDEAAANAAVSQYSYPFWYNKETRTIYRYLH